MHSATDPRARDDAARRRGRRRPRAPLVLALGGLSKYAALPQLKLAWMVSGGPRRSRSARAARDPRGRLPLGGDAGAARAAGDLRARARDARGDRGAARAQPRQLARAIAGTAATLLRADGGWYAVLRLPATRSDDEWALRCSSSAACSCSRAGSTTSRAAVRGGLVLLAPEPRSRRGRRDRRARSA
jgi:aspartate/methionine/tyrosine aminotransferase